MKKMKLDIQLFNGSCSITSITETTNINTNQSTFTITAKTSATGSTYNGQKGAYMTAQWKYASASEWTSLTQQKFSISKESSVSKSWDLTLDHNADGTLANINVRIKWYISSSTNGTTGASNVTPTTIPRASQPTLNYSSREFGQSVVITTNRYSSSFTHTLTYAFGGTSGTIATNVGASHTWTIPNALMDYIPNSTSGSCVITCKTYNGSTEIGAKYVSLTLNVPESVIPTISNVTQQEVGDVPSSWNTAVQNKSKLKFTITASGAYSSTISSYEIKGDGYTYTTNPATTNYIRSSGSMAFDFKVVDSRGRVATTSLTRVPVSYSNPAISTAQVQRCNASGVIDNNGEYMYISYGGSISSCNGYNKSYAVYKVGYRVHNTGSYTYVQLGTNANSYSASGMLFSDGIKAASSSGTKVQFSLNNTYDIQFYVQDYFTNSTNVQTLDAGFDLMNFNPSGKAMAIGKVSEAGANEELLEIGMNTNITGTLAVDKIDYNQGLYFKEDGYGDKFRIIPMFGGFDDSNVLLIQGAVGGEGTDPDLYNIFAITALSGNIWSKGTYNANNGFYSKPDGNVSTQTATDALVIKRATAGVDDAPNTGVVLEYGRWNGWGGQLYIGDNGTQGIWFNGWNNGVRGIWRKLMPEPIVLFSGMSNGQDVQLSDDINNYDYVEIEYGNTWDSRRVERFIRNGNYVLENRETDMSSSNFGVVDTFCQYQNNGTTLKFIGAVRVFKYLNDTNWSQDTYNDLNITKIWGYKAGDIL